MPIKLKGFFYYFSFIVVFIFLPGQKIKAQYKILNTGVEYIDSLFLSLPLDANNPGEDLFRIKEAVNQVNIVNQVKILTNIGSYYLGSEINDSARVYFHKGLELSKKNKLEYSSTICLMGLARIHAVFAEYDNAIEKLDQALIFTLKSDSAELISNIYRIYGNTYWGMEIYDLALESYYKSLEVAEENKLNQNIAAAYNNIGNIYSSIKDYENSIKYLRLAFKTAKEFDYKWVVAVSSNNIGSILTELGAHDSALYFYRISSITSRDLGGRIHEGVVAFNIGDTYLKLDSIELAKNFLTQSYNIAIETDDNIGLANSLLKLGELELVNGNLFEAKQYLDSGLAITIKIGSFSLQQEAYKHKNEYFKKVNNPDSIVKCMERLLFLKDTLAQIENIENITRLEYKYKEKVSSQEIAILQKEKKINKLLIFISSSAAILILIILSMFLSISRRKNKELNRINNLIEEQQDLLKQKNTELTISQDKLEKMVYDKDKFITIMSHDLKNPVNSKEGIGTKFTLKFPVSEK